MALSEDGRFCVANYYPVLWFCCEVESNLRFPFASGLGSNHYCQAVSRLGWWGFHWIFSDGSLPALRLEMLWVTSRRMSWKEDSSQQGLVHEIFATPGPKGPGHTLSMYLVWLLPLGNSPGAEVSKMATKPGSWFGTFLAFRSRRQSPKPKLPRPLRPPKQEAGSRKLGWTNKTCGYLWILGDF